MRRKCQRLLMPKSGFASAKSTPRATSCLSLVRLKPKSRAVARKSPDGHIVVEKARERSLTVLLVHASDTALECEPARIFDVRGAAIGCELQSLSEFSPFIWPRI